MNNENKDTIIVGADIAKKIEPTLASSSRDELILSMKKDASFTKAIKDLSISDDEIKEYFPLVYAFYLDMVTCEKCPGYASCPKEIPQTMSQLKKDSFGFIDRSFGPCALRAKKEKIEASYIVRDFPDEYLDANPKNIGKNDMETLGAIVNFTRALNGDGKPWIFYHGEEGSGKSYTLAAFSNFMAEQGATVAFLDTPKRFDELKGLAINNKDRFDVTMKMYMGCDLLVLDNFGAEFKSEYLRDQILLPLLSERASKGECIIFSSTFSQKEIVTLYSSLGQRASGQIQGNVLNNLFAKNVEKEVEAFFKVESLFKNKKKTFKGI